MPTRIAAPLLLTLTLAASAADYLPLQPGNSWTYREPASGQSFTIRIGTPLGTQDGQSWYRLTGYVDRPLWVRAQPDGTLLYLDEEAGRELILTSFEDAAPAWAAAPFRPCEQESQPTGKEEPVLTPIGPVSSTKTLRYRSFSCADAGVQSETYAPNLGLLQRTVQTLAGPRTFHLAEARIGNLVFAGQPAASFHAALRQNPGGSFTAALRLTLTTAQPLILQYPTSQDYDLVLWDAQGQPVYRWSDGRAFAQAARTRTVVGALAHDVEIQPAAPLPDGSYVLEAWLDAGPGQRAFSALTPVQIKDGQIVP